MSEEDQIDTNFAYYDYDYSYEGYVETDVANGIYTYTAPVLLLLGTMGNAFTLVIMRHLSHHVLSSCIYLAFLAVVDLLVLYTRCGNEWLLNIAQIDLSNQLMVTSDVICKVYPFVFNFIFHISRWLLVSIAVEGFITTKYPERVGSMCTPSRAKAVILLLIVLLISINIHYFWSFELVGLNDFHYGTKMFFCTFAKHGHHHSEVFQQIIWPILDLLVTEVLPYMVVIACGATMLKRILQGTHKGDEAHQRWRKRYQLNPDAMDELKITILVICASYLLLTLPKFSFSIFRYISMNYNLVEFSLKYEARQDLVRSICATLEYAFLSLKFFVYWFTSERFRSEFFKLLRRCFCGSCSNKLRMCMTRHCTLGKDGKSGMEYQNQEHIPEKQLFPKGCCHVPFVTVLYQTTPAAETETNHVTDDAPRDQNGADKNGANREDYHETCSCTMQPQSSVEHFEIDDNDLDLSSQLILQTITTV